MTSFSPIISPEALFARLEQPDLHIVDVRWVLGAPDAGRAAYEAGHIPGALFLDLDTDLAAPNGPGRHPLPDPAVFRERLEALGIGSADEVVAYDDVAGGTAARLWWMLDDLGHERVAVLDGGLKAWLAAGYPVTTDPSPARPRGRLDISRRMDEHHRSRGGRGGPRVDGPARCASHPAIPRRRRADRPVPGHIPTAVNCPGAASLGPDGRLLTGAHSRSASMTWARTGPTSRS